MKAGWKRRAVVWVALAESVRANMRAYPTLPTAWLPHALGNTLTLWLPEIALVLDKTCGLQDRCQQHAVAGALYRSFDSLCMSNPSWGNYIIPAALGYVLSHPRFNIYKGELAEWEFAGFGLDAIPHSTTAFGLTLLLEDAIATLGDNMPEDGPLSPLLSLFSEQPALFSGLVLLLLSTVWEVGEYWMRQDELKRADGDESAVNMEWDRKDMTFDLISNFAGWGAASWLRNRAPRVPHAPHPRPTSPAAEGHGT